MTERRTPRSKRAAVALALATSIAVPAEGLRRYAYEDIANPSLLTVCWGSTTDVVRDRFYSLDECRDRLNADMLQAIDTVERCVPGLPEPALAAFADAVFNLGPTIVCNRDRSTAARLLTSGDLVGACLQLPRWNKARVAGVMVELPGLTKRRAKEMALCLTGA